MVSSSELLKRIFWDCECVRRHGDDDEDITIIMSRKCFAVLAAEVYGFMFNPKEVRLFDYPVRFLDCWDRIEWYISTTHGEMSEEDDATET